MLDALQSGPNRDDTFVVFWSDHGYHLGEKWHWHKQALWQRATHVPLIFAGPGTGLAGLRCDRPASLIDIYPTLTELAGVPERAGLEGASLRGLLLDPASTRERPALSTFLRGNHAVTTERWRHIRYNDGSEELYDRRQDPEEWVNLAGRPDLAPAKRELARWLPVKDASDAPRIRDFQFDPAKVTWTPKTSG